MSDIAQFGLGALRATTAIVNYFSSGGVYAQNINAAAANNATEVLSGALTANTLATALSVTGGGEIGYLAVYTKDTTPRTVRIKVTVDGGTPAVFDATSSAIAVANGGLLVVGSLPSSTSNYVGAAIPLRWTTSMLIEIASSLTESNKVAIGYNLNKA